MNRLRLLALAVLVVVLRQAFGQDAPSEFEPPVTAAEASEYAQTGREADVRAFLEALAGHSNRIRLTSIGKSAEGREIQMAIVADPPVSKVEDVGDRMVVLMIGNIHAGEVCGKEALLMMARDLALGEKSSLLEKLVLCLVPNYNVDGNEKSGPDNRPGQNGPVEMGARENSDGLDLNRDYVKMDAPETRALIKWANEWDPTIFIDTHTTNGSHHRHLITYQGPKNPAADKEIVAYVRDTMLPAVDEAFEKASGYHAFFYGYFGDRGRDHTRWDTYPDEPRYGEGYFSLRNRVTILSEAYAYASFKDRVLATKAFCEAVLEYAARNREQIRRLTRDADRRVIEAGRNPSAVDRVAIRSKVVAFDRKFTVLGYEETREEGKPVVLGEERAYEVDLYNNFVPALEVQRPYAYLFPAKMRWLCELLQRHGIEVEVLREDIELDVEAERVLDAMMSSREYEGRTIVRKVETRVESSMRGFEPGWFVVRTGQKLGTLAVYLLEARSSDGLVTWNYFPDAMQSEAAFPVLRVPLRSPMTLRGVRALPEDRKTGRKLKYEDVHGSGRVNLNGSPVGGVRWVDDEHFVQRKDGQTLLVHARTGRTQPYEVDLDPIVERLSQLTTVDAGQARGIARSHFGRGGQTTGAVFEHAGDLYYADADGSNARRLTSSPGVEELSSLSPDGRFAAFVRDNDLYVVDVSTGVERAVTTGGTDALRHGKHTWVYFEELYNRDWKAYWWSPDGRSIAYFRTDASMVPQYTLVHDVPRNEGRVEVERYPRPGEPNPQVRVFIASVAGDAPREVDLSDYDVGGHLIAWVGWSEKAGKLRLGVTNRVQTWLDLLEVGAGGGTPTRLFRETTGAWVESLGDPSELKDGSFLLLSERDGWKHVYHFEKNGSLRRRITEGEWEVRSLDHVDEENGWIYFSGMRDSPIASNLYRVKFDGSELACLTPEPGNHRAQISTKGSLFIDSWSSYLAPTQVALRHSDGTLVRMIDTNPVYELEEWSLGRVEPVSIPSEKGVTLEGALLYPPDFAPDGKYPIWFKTYAGPHAPTVSDSWGGGRAGDQLLATQGIVIFYGDPYPASGKGAQAAWTCYRQFGIREMEDIEEMIRWVTAHPWADTSRVGMSGHSYGGFMTAFAMTHSTLFSAGIAGAPPTDWRDYDTIYTERYMLTPQDNPEGYANTSVVAAADNLHGRLLLLHGMIDDNVHPQNSVRFINALVDKDKQFEMFLYPGRRHGLYGSQYTRLMYDFMMRTMLGGEKPAEVESEADHVEEGEAIGMR